MQLRKMPRRKVPRKEIVERDSYILEACWGKKVLDIGCADAPLTKAKFELNALLYQKLEGVASTLAGLDLDAKSVAWLRKKGVQNLYVGDATEIEDMLPMIGFEPEVVVAGEVLEHLSHPLDFLISIRKGMINGAELIMSVPNAFYVEGFIHILLGKEKVHPEHVAYYSYHTIVQLIERAALEVKDVTPCKYQAINPKKRLTDMLQKPFLWFSPNFAPGYVVKAVAV